MTLRQRLLMMILHQRFWVWSPFLFLLPVYLLTYLNVIDMRQAFRNQNELALTSAARRLAERIDTFVKSNREAIGTEAQIEVLAMALKGEGNLRQAQQVLISLAAKNELYVTSYALLDRDGKNIVDTNSALAGRDESQADYFQVPRKNNQVFAGDLRFVQNEGVYVVFSAPVRDHDGNVIGVLRSQYSSAILQMLTSSGYGLLGRGSYGVLVDRIRGLVIGHGQKPGLVFTSVRPNERTIKETGQQAKHVPGLQWLAPFSVEGRPSKYLSVEDENGMELLGASVECAYSSWQVVYLQPALVLKEAFREQLLSTLILALATAILVIGMSLGMSQLLQRLRKREAELLDANEKVKLSLLREKQFSRTLARDIRLGSSVQKSLHQVPRLPTNIEIVVHHEAAKFVSGDTFFVHWNRPERTVAILLNDVTGHGVQAALKAAACQQIARSIWSAGLGALGKLKGQRLVDYDHQVESFLGSIGEDIPDFNAMLGAEVDLESGRMALYRANYQMPIVITPSLMKDGAKDWQTSTQVLRHRQLQFQNLPAGSFVILMSDGFLSEARHLSQILKLLKYELKQSGQRMTGQRLRHLLLTWDASTDRQHDDDKTFVILHWRGGSGGQDLAG